MPTVSVIVPVYKVESYLRRCVDSILNQTFTDFELILVDDGSPDGCPAICDEYAARDSRVHVIHQENGGLSAARNAGIDWAFANSDSQWLSFIDSDDWIHPQFLEVLFTASQTCETDISACRYIRTSGSISEKANCFLPKKISVEDYWTTEPLPMIACAKIYHRRLFHELRYPVGKLHEDQFTTYLALFQTSAIAVIPSPLYYYYHNQSSIMNSTWTPKRLDESAALEEQIRFFKERNYTKALVFSCNLYFMSYVNHYLDVANLSQPETALLNYLSGCARKAYRKHKKNLKVSFRKDKWIFNVMYPREMNMYWKIIALRNKICAIFKKR